MKLNSSNWIRNENMKKREGETTTTTTKKKKGELFLVAGGAPTLTSFSLFPDRL